MSAVTQENALCVCGSEHLCACGCGESLHPLIRRVHELLASGARVMQTARLLDIDKAQVATYRDSPPRLIKGHIDWQRPMVNCANPRCGRPFRQMGPRHLYCAYASSRPADEIRAECARLAFAAKRQVWNDHDAGVETRARERANDRAYRQKLDALFNRSTPAEWIAASVAVDDEALVSLIAEQAKDDRWDRAWDSIGMVALDREILQSVEGAGYENGLSLHNYLGDAALMRPELFDPADICINDEVAEQLKRLTGGMDIEDVARLDGQSLYWLQERMRAEGLTPHGVPQSERVRLRDPVTHSGLGHHKAPLIPGRKKRREKIAHKAANRARGNSNRPSQKPKNDVRELRRERQRERDAA